MMKFNKKLTIFAIILIIIGIIGSVWSGINAVPYFINTLSKIERDSNKEQMLYNEQIIINKIDISTKDTDITIKKHNKPEVVVSKKGNLKYKSYDINKEETKLTIKENTSEKNSTYRIKNLNDLVDVGVEEIFSRGNEQLIIYVPEEIDINVSTRLGDFNIENDIFLDSVVFKTLSGRISMPQEVKELNNLDIVSNENIELSMCEILGIKNVNIESRYAYIHSNENDIFIDNIENYIPENLTINQKSDKEYEYSIGIDTDTPVAKNLSINNYSGDVNLSLPIDSYKIIFDIKSSDGITIDNLENENDISKEIKSINGLLNKSLENLEQEYKVNIKGRLVYIN